MAHNETWSKTAASIEMLSGVEKLQQVSQLYQYDALILLSYMKIDVKNIHSVGYHKDKLFTVLDYPMHTHTHTHTHIHTYVYVYIYMYIYIYIYRQGWWLSLGPLVDLSQLLLSYFSR